MSVSIHEFRHPCKHLGGRQHRRARRKVPRRRRRRPAQPLPRRHSRPTGADLRMRVGERGRSGGCGAGVGRGRVGRRGLEVAEADEVGREKKNHENKSRKEAVWAP